MKFRQTGHLHHIRKAKAVKPSLIYYQLEFVCIGVFGYVERTLCYLVENWEPQEMKMNDDMEEFVQNTDLLGQI